MMPDRNTHQGFKAFMKLCDYRARCYVQGSAYHEKLKSMQPVTGGWSVQFKSHPRVLEAEAEGWSRDLRAALVAECKQRLMRDQDLGEPDDLMPKRREWWEGVRAQAARERASDLAMSSGGPVRGPARAALSEVAKRMTGEASGG